MKQRDKQYENCSHVKLVGRKVILGHCRLFFPGVVLEFFGPFWPFLEFLTLFCYFLKSLIKITANPDQSRTGNSFRKGFFVSMQWKMEEKRADFLVKVAKND